MMSFVEFILAEDGAVGGAPATSTAGVVGTGDDKKTVVVRPEIRNKYKDDNAAYQKNNTDLTGMMRRINGLGIK